MSFVNDINIPGDPKVVELLRKNFSREPLDRLTPEELNVSGISPSL